MEIPISDRPDAELVREATGGDSRAFNALVRRWERKVYSYLVHVMGRPEDAFDICQETFLSAYTSLRQLKDQDKFPYWLFRIAHNAACSYARQAGQEAIRLKDLNSAVDSATVGVGQARQWERGELRILMERALVELPVEQRETIVLKFYQGFKLTEIAEIQGCPLSTVKSRMYSGFEALKKFIES